VVTTTSSPATLLALFVLHVFVQSCCCNNLAQQPPCAGPVIVSPLPCCLLSCRHHQRAEQPVTQQLSALAEGSVLDDGSRMIVVSWMVEVAEEFGLQQETLHAAVTLLDRFLSTGNVSSRLRLLGVSLLGPVGGWVGGWAEHG